MKRLNFLLTSLLVLFWAFPGPAAAQSSGGLGGPLDKVVDKAADPGKVLEDAVDEVKKPVDKAVDEVKKPVDKAVTSLPGPVKKPVENVTKEVDQVVKSVTGAAKNSAEAPGAVVDNAGQGSAVGEAAAAGDSKPDHSDSVNSATWATGTRVAAGKSTGATKGTSRAESARDTEEVAAAGNAIEPAQVKGVQIVAPATEVEDSEGSGLSHTGVQILSWLFLACLLVGAGMALARRGRARVRAARA